MSRNLPGSNALEVADAVQALSMRELQTDFPPGIAYEIIYNPSEVHPQLGEEVQRTLLDATILVVIVVILFLQSWRTALIPLLAIPVSIIGTCTVLGMFEFSLNNLSMFGLVLSIGIVIDDAIVVIENVERHMRAGLSAREAAHVTMDEVGGALIGIALVLVAVFVPTAFMGGIAGPVLPAVRAHHRERDADLAHRVAEPDACAGGADSEAASAGSGEGPAQPHRRTVASASIASAIDAGARGARAVRASSIMLVLYVGLSGAGWAWRILDTPRGFIPAQDQGTVSMQVQLPVGATLARTDAITQQVLEIILTTPGVWATSTYAGIDGNGFNLQSSSTQLWAIFDPFEERLAQGLTAAKITADLRKRLSCNHRRGYPHQPAGTCDGVSARPAASA